MTGNKFHKVGYKAISFTPSLKHKSMINQRHLSNKLESIREKKLQYEQTIANRVFKHAK